MTRIYIGNLSFSTTEESLKAAFEAFGTVEEAVVIMDKFTNRSKGFGFVNMTDDEAASKAISSLNGQEIDGRKVRVSQAEERTSRRPAPRR